MDQFVMISTPRKTQKFLLAQAAGVPSLTIEEILDSCEPWPRLINRLTVAVVIHSVDNNNITVGHLPKELSHLLWHFLIHREEIKFKVTERQGRSPLIQGGLKISCYVTFHGEEVGSRSNRHCNRRKIKLSRNLPVQLIRMVIHFKSTLVPQIRAN